MNMDMYSNLPPALDPKLKLARAYVPFQVMGKVYCPEEALDKGTLFPELYRPYKPEVYKKK